MRRSMLPQMRSGMPCRPMESGSPQCRALVESTNLLVMEGRRIVSASAQLPAGEADPVVLQQRLDANRAPIIGFAQALREVSLKALDAIDAKDPNRLFEVGGGDR
jgi:hypothetical protein